MLNAAFRQYLADRWLLNGRLNSGTSEMDETEPMELAEDDGECKCEDGEPDVDDAERLLNNLPQPHVGAGIVLCSPPCWLLA